jgi:hypothetical protein
MWITVVWVASIIAAGGYAQTVLSATSAAAPPPVAETTAKQEQQAAPKRHQSDVASNTITFASADRTNTAYAAALDAHDLDAMHRLIDQTGAFKGTASGTYEPGDGDMIILNFDPQYRMAVSAVLKRPDFAKFPDVKKLVGKEILVTGKFVDYQGRAEMVLTSPDQIKLVQ